MKKRLNLLVEQIADIKGKYFLHDSAIYILQYEVHLCFHECIWYETIIIWKFNTLIYVTARNI